MYSPWFNLDKSTLIFKALSVKRVSKISPVMLGIWIWRIVCANDWLSSIVIWFVKGFGWIENSSGSGDDVLFRVHSKALNAF